MPPKKARNGRTAPTQPQAPIPSDYDTEDPSLPIPAPPKRRNSELNLLVLRRYLPALHSTISIAAFAVVYTFSPAASTWEKTGQEGTLFLCQLASEDGSPRFSVVVLNRKGLENFVVEIQDEEMVQVSEEYIMLQVEGEDGEGKVYGLWVFSEEGEVPTTLERMSGAMRECARLAEGSGVGDGEVQGEDDGYEDEDQTEDEGYEENYETAFSHDGVAQPAYEMAPPIAQPALVGPGGQRIDLLKLFSQPQPQAPSQPSAAPAFRPSPDTDFFRASKAPINPAGNGAPLQQNALLDLFKNAKRG
nr:hypothetical protein B0A51_17168 [Rachicladosporium sp. CCFEE 5018]